QLERAPYEAARRTIDVSGDGTNNAGRDVKLARDEALAKGIVINGLVILSDRPVPWNAEHTNPPGGLDKYYQDNVVGGPGAFVLVAENFNSFARASIKRGTAETALLPPPPRIGARWAGGRSPDARDCRNFQRCQCGGSEVRVTSHNGRLRVLPQRGRKSGVASSEAGNA